MITIRPIPAFDDNYIWLIRQDGRSEVALVDPGDADPVIELLEREGLRPLAILITHHHYDHTGGVMELVARYGCEVYGPANEKIPGRTHAVTEGDEVLFDDLRFEVIETPGHTRGHVCYYGHGTLFCGDTLFAAGCGRLFEGTAEQMHASLEKITALPDNTQIFCAHEYTLANLRFALTAEPDNTATRQRQEAAKQLRAEGKPTVPSSLALEKATNPFLRFNNPALKKNAEQFAGRTLQPGAELFAVVRHWKDTLD